jgi:hypothetical protein
MDSNNPKEKPAQLLSDLESIRQLLEPAMAEPPLLTDSIDPRNIPLLSDIVPPAFSERPLQPIPPQPAAPPRHAPAARPPSLELNRLEGELRIAAELILQDVIDDFVPQIEAELRRRLEEHLPDILSTRRQT